MEVIDINKTERLAYEWLKRRGIKGIVYQKKGTPDFITENGSFEAKRGYKTKMGDIKIIFTLGQREKLMEANSKVLVFLDGSEPVAIIEPEDLGRKKVDKIILHDYRSPGREAITITLTEELVRAIDRERKRYALDRSEFIESCLREGRRVGVGRRGIQY